MVARCVGKRGGWGAANAPGPEGFAQGTGLGKTVRPRIHEAFARTRLFRLLDRHRRTPILWIAAPPGAGKTTLVSSYVDARRLHAAWYQIDEGDADIAAFFFHLGRLTTRRRGRAARPLPRLRPEHWVALPAFTRQYFAELARRLRSPFVLVFDNYQDVPAHARLHEVLADGLAMLPTGSRVVIISRHEPPESFARLRAHGALRLIDDAELRLTVTESAGIARRRAPAVPPGLIRRLHERADGWAAGLVLLLEATSVAADGAEPHGLAPEAVFDYFAAEIFRKADPARQDFLLQTAFLPRMTSALAIRLTGVQAAPRMLASLHASNYFTERRVHDEAVYQYHPLFREFLQARARTALSRERLVDLLRRAARLLVEEGQADHAAVLLRDAGDADGLAALVVTHARALVEQGRYQTLEEWASHVPGPVAEEHAWLSYWLGIARTPFAPAVARRHLERAYGLFRARGDVIGVFSAWSGAVGTILYEWSDFTELDRWIDDLERMLGERPEFPSPEIRTRVTATMFYALVFRRPEHPAIDTWAERAEALSRAGDVNRRMQTGFMLTTYHLWRGRLAAAAATLEQLRALARSPDASPLVTLSWRVVEAYYHWHVAEPDLCLRAAASGLDLADQTGIHLMDPNLLAQGVYGALIAGDRANARTLLNRLAGFVAGARNVHESQYHFLMGWDALLGGDRPRALEHTRRALESVSGAPFPRAWNEIALGIVLHEMGKETEADEHLALGRAIGRTVRSTMIEFMSLLAETEFALDRGRDDEAVAGLRAAMTLGHAHGYRVIPWWRPRVAARLCARALDEGIETAYVQDLVRRHGLSLDEPVLAPDAWPWPVSLCVLGGFALARDGAPVTFTGKVQQKPLALLKLLVALGGRDVPETRLADTLWPDATGDAAHQAFAATLHRLRVLVGHPHALRLQDGRLSLDPQHVWLDVWTFERLLREAERIERLDGARFLALLGRAVALYRGPFLGPEGSAEWAVSAAERLRSRFLRASGRLGRHWTESGDWERAIDAYERALAVEDLAEEFYQGLMTCHARLGRHAEALRAYARCRRALAATLGVEPSPATQALARALGHG
jgi:ATP/maltotriose-dependent transcriptional regulator MalT/DNA-binding SARP family transcriptional activator